MFAKGDRVELTGAMRAYGLEEGERGIIVDVHRDHRTYIVAFARDGRDLGIYDVPYSLLRHAGGERQ